MTSNKAVPKRAASKRPTSAQPKKARILVVDDHPTMREGLTSVLEREPDLMVCGQAATIREALAAAESSKPDLAVVDISLAGQNGIELIKDLKIRFPELLVLVHSMHDETVYAERALRAGARGYIMKHETPRKLLVAIRQVLEGKSYLSDAMTDQLLHRMVTPEQRHHKTSPILELTDREFEIFALIGQGLRTAQIAETLHLSPKTVQTHRENIKQKLSLRDSANLVQYAIRWAQAPS